MAEAMEIGTISSRGQIAIPADIRAKMHLKEGEKVLFILEGDLLMMKPVHEPTWEEITRPLREAAKKAGLKEEDVPGLIHRMRKQKRQRA